MLQKRGGDGIKMYDEAWGWELILVPCHSALYAVTELYRPKTNRFYVMNVATTAHFFTARSTSLVSLLYIYSTLFTKMVAETNKT